MQSTASPTTPTSTTTSMFHDAHDTLVVPNSGDDDGIAQELAQLEALRQNVKRNLMLRPISTQNLREAASSSSKTAELSSTRQMPGGYPFTPAVHPEPPSSAASTGSDVFYSARPLSSASVSSYYFGDQQMQAIGSPASATFLPPGSFPKSPFVQSMESYQPMPPAIQKPPPPQSNRTPTVPQPSSQSNQPPQVYDANQLLDLLLPLNYPSASQMPRALLLDTRPAGSYLASRVIYSINLAIPSLILKRHRKSLQKGGAGFPSLESLKAYVSTDAGRRNWVELMGGDDDSQGTSLWNGEIIVFDEEMDESDPLAPTQSPQSGTTPSSTGSGLQSSHLSSTSTAAWTLLTLLRPLTSGPLYYLKGGITALRRLEGSEEVVVSGEWEIEDEEDSDGIDEGSDAAASSDAQSSVAFSVSNSGGDKSRPSVDTPSTGTPQAKSLTTPNLKLLGSPNPRGTPQGLSMIRTDVAAKHRPLPEIEPPTTSPKLADMAPSEATPQKAAELAAVPRDTTTSTVSLKPPPSPRKAKTLALDLSSPDSSKTPRMLSLNIPAANSERFKPRLDGERPTHQRLRSGGSGDAAQAVKTPPSAVHLKLGDNRPWQQYDADGRKPPSLQISTNGHQLDTRQETNLQPTRPTLAKLDVTSAERLKTLAQIEGRPEKPTLGLAIGGPPKLQLRTLPGRSHTVASDMSTNHLSTTDAAAAKPKLRLDKLNVSTNHQSNVLIVNTPSSPDNSTSFARSETAYLPPPSPGASSTQFSVGGLSAAPARPRTPKSPLTPLLPPSPMTARPNDPDPTSPTPVFTISTILPGFLFLGPELVKEEHAAELESLGVRRILNLAIECDDDAGLNLKDRFKYVRIPMRDTVEEVNVMKAMKEVCDIIDDARLHSAPTYVHCKAGKSRSVTAVMAYLIHANHWTLSRAYAFVLDRRKGISPNIGFVSELMNFEEDELGGKSVGVVGAAGQVAGPVGRRINHRHHRQASKNDGSSTARRRPAHLRESMPPIVQSYSAAAAVGEHDTFSGGLSGKYPTNGGLGPNGAGELPNGQLMSAGPLGGAKGHVPLRDVGEEMEVRDAEGRYRHARRAPVDELTLQPVRRVSKAGLETTWATDS